MILIGAAYKSNKFIYIGLGTLIFCSFPFVSNKLVIYSEKNFKLLSYEKTENVDAIVVLSGMVRPVHSENGYKYEWRESSDRIFAGIDLFKMEKAPLLVLTRGTLPWSVGISEGDYLLTIAKKHGILDENIVLTENVQNTFEEAMSVKKVLKMHEPKITLVTSAFHMIRAKQIFEKAGIVVNPFPVDFRARITKFSFLYLLPSAESFGKTSFIIRELIGRLYYKIKY